MLNLNSIMTFLTGTLPVGFQLLSIKGAVFLLGALLALVSIYFMFLRLLSPLACLAGSLFAAWRLLDHPFQQAQS
jgi:hypothetical protein